MCVRRKLPWRLGAALLAAGALLWLAWGFWRSAHSPVSRCGEIGMPGLTEPVRLAVLSDLHESLDEADRQKLVTLVEEAAPDLILLDGDMLNSDSADAAGVCTLTELLSQITPVYCALGNHEIAYLEAGTSPLLEELEQAGATVLDQSYVDLDLGGGIRLGGLYE